METAVDLSTLEALLLENNERLSMLIDTVVQSNEVGLSIYAALLFALGVLGATGVCVLLYNFLRKFY